MPTSIALFKTTDEDEHAELCSTYVDSDVPPSELLVYAGVTTVGEYCTFSENLKGLRLLGFYGPRGKLPKMTIEVSHIDIRVEHAKGGFKLELGDRKTPCAMPDWVLDTPLADLRVRVNVDPQSRAAFGLEFDLVRLTVVAYHDTPPVEITAYQAKDGTRPKAVRDLGDEIACAYGVPDHDVYILKVPIELHGPDGGWIQIRLKGSVDNNGLFDYNAHFTVKAILGHEVSGELLERGTASVQVTRDDEKQKLAVVQGTLPIASSNALHKPDRTPEDLGRASGVVLASRDLVLGNTLFCFTGRFSSVLRLQSVTYFIVTQKLDKAKLDHEARCASLVDDARVESLENSGTVRVMVSANTRFTRPIVVTSDHISFLGETADVTLYWDFEGPLFVYKPERGPAATPEFTLSNVRLCRFGKGAKRQSMPETDWVESTDKNAKVVMENVEHYGKRVKFLEIGRSEAKKPVEPEVKTLADTVAKLKAIYPSALLVHGDISRFCAGMFKAMKSGSVVINAVDSGNATDVILDYPLERTAARESITTFDGGAVALFGVL
jgi:hypothetical protein